MSQTQDVLRHSKFGCVALYFRAVGLRSSELTRSAWTECAYTNSRGGSLVPCALCHRLVIAVLVAALVGGLVFFLGSMANVFTGDERSSSSPGTVLLQTSLEFLQGPQTYLNIPAEYRIPAFTTEDMREYIKANGFAGGPGPSRKAPTIVKIAFMTYREAGLAGHGKVCYVILRGPFSRQNAAHTPGAIVQPARTGYEVFDAQTGRFLMWGVS